MTPLPDIAPRSRVVPAPGGDLAVREYGDPRADTLVLVHGLTDTQHIWKPVARMLADSFHVVTYDVRGHGRSAKATRPHHYRLECLTEDLYAVLDAISPDRPVHLAGHGWGAIQVWEALTDPRANTRIVSATALGNPGLDPIAHALREKRFPRTRWWRLPGLGWLVLGRRLLRWPRIRRAPRADLAVAPADLLAGARIAAANLPHRLRNPRERRIAAPIQLIVDRADAAVLPAAGAHVRRVVDRLWCYRLPADHWLPITEPLLVVEAIANFIDDLRADNRPIEYTPR
ncbi:alpha/beta fold hydrolase [Nocardia pseudobrasiliensis]|uniref:Alpha-beta hydrolase superfamily lysophospholipase n=1 Tax=Nocardia pseudobrasiliensis TaxID=45979 RepID=A0A370HYN1_9NOCA|nr:alpha/beta fold hydrolase [Nocardia pseudobrasiliensis]RDI63623.1 alpha-beta hydrolase superfamily lysophospholipase [Nocardia pseudobrasiliensis]